MTESEEELNSLLMRVKEENEKAGIKLNIQKTEIMAGPWGKEGGKRPREDLQAPRVVLRGCLIWLLP